MPSPRLRHEAIFLLVFALLLGMANYQTLDAQLKRLGVNGD